MNSKSLREELIEQLAAIEHERWAHWQKYMHNTMFKDGDYMCLAVPRYEHWERQINTPYSELSEKEKQSDREQVMRYLPLFFFKFKEMVERMKFKEEIRAGDRIIKCKLLMEEKKYNQALQDILDNLENK